MLLAEVEEPSKAAAGVLVAVAVQEVLAVQAVGITRAVTRPRREAVVEEAVTLPAR
jgi:hypothetical protein